MYPSPRSPARRRALACLALSGLTLPGWTSALAEDTLLSESDPGALGVAYRADASQVDPARNPSYRPGRQCANCSLYAGEPGQRQGGCGLFYGKEVSASGWCNAWDPKPV